mgnify:CR=1 FL=1
MNQIPLVIIEDEAPARAKLVQYVQQDSRFSIVGQAKNGREALTLLEEKKPGVMLLDIQMPGMTGFDVLRLMENRNVAVIFTTAYEQYAIQAFDASAIDYILKPVTKQRLHQALSKAYTYLGVQNSQKISKLLGLLSEAQSANNIPPIKRLAVRQQRSVQLLPIEDIAFIRTEHRLVHVYDRLFNKFWTNELLTELESRLPTEQFMRIHRGAIVNLNTQLNVESWNSGRLRIHINSLDNVKTEVLTVSREHTKKLRNLYKI